MPAASDASGPERGCVGNDSGASTISGRLADVDGVTSVFSRA